MDFVSRTYKKGIKKESLTSLILADCFDSLGYNKKTLVNNLDTIINYAELSQGNDLLELPQPEIEEYDEYTEEELINTQLEIFGFYLSNHPITRYREKQDVLTNKIHNYYDKVIKMTLLITKVKEITTKKNDVMAFITASDEFGTISLTLFPKTYKNYQKIKKNDIIKVTGKIEKRYDTYQMIVNTLITCN